MYSCGGVVYLRHTREAFTCHSAKVCRERTSGRYDSTHIGAPFVEAPTSSSVTIARSSPFPLGPDAFSEVLRPMHLALASYGEKIAHRTSTTGSATEQSPGMLHRYASRFGSCCALRENSTRLLRSTGIHAARSVAMEVKRLAYVGSSTRIHGQDLYHLFRRVVSKNAHPHMCCAHQKSHRIVLYCIFFLSCPIFSPNNPRGKLMHLRRSCSI